MPTYKLQESAVNESGDWELIPEGTVLDAEVIGVTEKLAPFKDRTTGEDVYRLDFSFVITDEKYTNRRIWGETPTTFSTNPDCVLRAWAQEIFGVNQLAPGYDLNTDDLVRGKCRIAVGHRTYKDKKTDTDKTVQFVSDVIRMQGEEPF